MNEVHQASSRSTEEPQHQHERYLTKKEVAHLLRLTPRTVEAYMRQGTLPYVRIGSRTVRFRESDIEAALTSINARN
jgi:excisionase family DNA binding protein